MKFEILDPYVTFVVDAIEPIRKEVDARTVITMCNDAMSYIKALRKMAEAEVHQDIRVYGRDNE